MSAARLLPIALAVAAVGLLVAAVLDVHAAFEGWLIAFVLAGLAPIGAVALLLIGRLTGASWTGPLVPIAAATPVLCVFALPVIGGYALIFPWSSATLDPLSGQPVWLAPAFFIVRTVLVVGGWSTLAILAMRRPITPLLAGLGLLAHGLFVSIAAYDWVLSIQPGWVNTDMGMSLAAQQIGAACAAAGLLGWVSRKQAPAYVGLLAAALLGVAYLALMDYIIVWYGNLPEKVSWYMRRQSGLWWVLAPIATVIGLVIPLPVLGFGGGWQRKLAVAGAFGVTGLVLYDVWMMAPAFGVRVLPAILFAGVLQIGVMLWLAGRASPSSLRGAAHAG